ncbi:MAG: hypothetical protein EB027_05590 [Actinobacteria bacterium]|nr:hypothetical protein [Actinomycetota bacterium]
MPPERTTALPDTPLATAMESLTDRAGLAGTRLRVLPVAADSTEINAYAAGSGPMARVVVYDTLLHDVPQSHVLSVLAHELGHVKYRDSLVLTVASSTCAGLAVLGLGLLWRRRRPGAVRLPFRLTELPPVVAAAMVMMLVMLPASNALSRTVEARADVYALELTDNPKAFARVMRTIAVQGQSYLGDEKPWGWARSHPTIAWRLALARAWARDHGIVLPPTSADVRPQGTR